MLVDTRLRDTAIRFEQIETDFIRLRDFVLNDLETLPEHWLAVAPSLYDALRNDIVHRYDTQRIRVDGRDIELAITWGSGRHLTFANGQLVLAVPDLAAGLRRAFDAYEAALRADGALRDRFQQRLGRGHIRNVGNPTEHDACRDLLEAPPTD